MLNYKQEGIQGVMQNVLHVVSYYRHTYMPWQIVLRNKRSQVSYQFIYLELQHSWPMSKTHYINLINK